MVKLFLVLALVAAASALPRIQRKVPGGGRIVGGIDAKPYGEIPYQLSLQLKGSHICGASLIKEDVALTSASCVFREFPPNLKIHAGVHDRSQLTGREQLLSVRKFVVHENFSSVTLNNDIALLFLSTKAVLNLEVALISIPPQEAQTTGKILASGWGSIREDSSFRTILQKVSMYIVSDEKCQEKYPDQKILPSMICAGGPTDNTCKGDSGGPLVAESGATAGHLVGIISWKYGCSQQPIYLGVNTEVSYFSDWIAEVIEKESCSACTF